jgi:hypothetical protein
MILQPKMPPAIAPECAWNLTVTAVPELVECGAVGVDADIVRLLGY